MVPDAVLAVAIVVVIGVILLRIGRAIRASWLLVRLWRWLSGEAHHGHPITDAGWLRHGQRALTRTGHATRWWHLPRWQRAAHRTGGTLAVIALAWSGLAYPAQTVLGLSCAAACSLVLGAYRTHRRLMRRRHEKTWLRPLHLAAHDLAGHPRAIRAASWIKAEIDKTGAVTEARLALPSGWQSDPKEEQRLVAIAAAKLAIESPEASWRRAGPVPHLLLTHSQPPPSMVRYEDVADAVAQARRDELVVGIGKKGTLVKASLATDSPHLAVNMGTGGGKSNLAAFWLMQELRRGAIAMVLDSKWWSHAWLYKDEQGEYDFLPNVAYLSSPAQLHAGMMWLGAELDRRNQVARRAVTAAGTLRGDVGPRIIILAEELNQAMPLVRQYWADTRDPSEPKRSPALNALGAVAFAGRAVKMHLVLIGQMLTAEVTGSRDSSVKENVGITAMARYGPAGWATAVGKNVPMPPSPSVVGRVQLVTAGGVRETQVPLGDMLLYRELAVSGTVTPCPAGMPGAMRQVAAVPDAVPVSAGASDQRFVPETSPALGPAAVTLSEAVEQRIVRRSLAAVRKASQRDDTFPERTGMRGLAAEYDPVALAEWDAGRR